MSLRTWTLTVRRFNEGEYVEGVWQEAGSTTFDIKCSLQPLSAKEMQLLPEGRRDRVTFNVFTDTLLKAAETGKANADTIEITGDLYEVLSCESWQNQILPHYKAVISKVTNA